MRALTALMRYAHQDFYRLTGRDPDDEPMTPIEREILLACLKERFESEAPSIAAEDQV